MKTIVVRNIKRADAEFMTRLAAGMPRLDMCNMRESLKKACLVSVDEPPEH